jgi:hypothetical protein
MVREARRGLSCLELGLDLDGVGTFACVGYTSTLSQAVAVSWRYATWQRSK